MTLARATRWNWRPTEFGERQFLTTFVEDLLGGFGRLLAPMSPTVSPRQPEPAQCRGSRVGSHPLIPAINMNNPAMISNTLGRERHVYLCLEPVSYARPSISQEALTMWRRIAPMDVSTGAVFLLAGMFIYSARLTSIVFCTAHDERPLLIAAAAFCPVGVVHGLGVWLGGS
jgi:hypothetical protein